MRFYSSIVYITLLIGSLSATTTQRGIYPRLDNGLAKTPPMGWNSYNHYSCSPNESIIHSNAQALVDLGLQVVGYHYVTVDCGWTVPNRTADGKLTWNPERFPSGYPALGEFLHDRNLSFGVYSDGGVQMCMTGDPVQIGSLSHETTDAETFASWGADLLKYDNCYSTASKGYPDADYTPDVSPFGRYKNMSEAVLSTGRPILFQICDWGVDFPSAWAPQLGNSWRITNDIIPAYRTIPRILNQAVPQTSFAGPGQWLDLDMLEVGNDVFTAPEEQTHFSLWAIIKSPLVIGSALKDAYTSISESSLEILKQTEVIAFNQDPLGSAASFRRRWTQEGYEVWAGPLSGGRLVVALINLFDEPRNLTLDLPVVGIQKAKTLKDIWNKYEVKDVLTSYTASVGAHGTILLELSDLTVEGKYTDHEEVKAATSQSIVFPSVYGITTSSNYTATLTFPEPMLKFDEVLINNKSFTFSDSSKELNISLYLEAGMSNSVEVVSKVKPEILEIAAPPSIFYPSTVFNTSGSAVSVKCYTDLCKPVGSKIGYLSNTGTASISIKSPYPTITPSSKYVEIYFCNNDIAFSTSWSTGTNTRNMTISVNGVLTRVELPLSGRSSELFSPGLGWMDTGTFGVLVPGWGTGKDGYDEVVVGNVGGDEGLVSWGADFVGLEVMW